MKMECVEIDALGTGYDYAALGHIHRPQDVSERARYCGTPIPVSFDEMCEHSVSIVEIGHHGDLPHIETKVIKNPKPLHTLPPHQPVDIDTAAGLLQNYNPNEKSYIRLNVLVDRFLPNGSMQRAAQAVKDKQCRFCEIKRTATAIETRHTTQLTVEQFNKMQPIEVVNRYFVEETGQPMTQQQQEMFKEAYQEVEKENRE
jgi:exonuclease SbcD